jgi:hypothetical protein
MRFFGSIFNVLRFNKKNWKAVVLCSFAATVFWFFNALNKSYTTNISFPLYFDFNHENYVPVTPLPKEVRINVSGIGWNLFRRSSGIKVPPLTIPLDRPSEVKKIVGSALPGFFSNQLEGLEINFVITDTLYVNVQPKAGRWLRLSLDSVQQNIDRHYTLSSDVKMVPESVFVEGPMSIVTKLEEPARLKISERNIDASFRQDVKIDFAQGNLIKCNPSYVQVAFGVEKFVNVTDSVKLEIINMPPKSRPWIKLNKIPCTIGIRESLVKEFNADNVKAVIDLKEFKRGNVKLVPQLMGLPKYSRVIKIDSVRIHY